MSTICAGAAFNATLDATMTSTINKKGKGAADQASFMSSVLPPNFPKSNRAKDEETLQLEEYQKMEHAINATIVDQLTGKFLQYGQIIQVQYFLPTYSDYNNVLLLPS